MAKALTVTLSDRVHAALTKLGNEHEQDAPGMLRILLISAGIQPEGIRLKLDLPPLVTTAAPLFEHAGLETPAPAAN